jgi:hypothetical protein
MLLRLKKGCFANEDAGDDGDIHVKVHSRPQLMYALLWINMVEYQHLLTALVTISSTEFLKNCPMF